MIKACIFDLDGTLTNTLDSLEYSVNETMKEIGMPQITKEQCRQFVGDGAKVLLERTLKAGGIKRAGASAASQVIMMLVPITVFVISQSNIIETMGSSGMKD